MPEYSRSQISNWIKSGAITVNNKHCKPKDKIASNDLVEICVDLNQTRSDFNLCQAEYIPLNIVFERLSHNYHQ